MSKIGLSSLIAPNSIESFFDKNWPHAPFVVHGLKTSIQQLTALPFLTSLDDLLNSWPGLVQAHLPDVADELSAVDANPRDAKKLFSNKMSLLFNNVQSISPVLRQWLDVLKADLGLPNSTQSRCMIYATPDGGGTAAHFDQNVNFVVQIHGTKTWWLAANESVIHPTERHTIGQPLDPELASYAHDEMPNAMPSDRTEIVLNPGSMLFVPRGFWHCTEAKGPALALNFTFNQPAWADIFLLALRSRLLLSPEWRELADQVSAKDPARRKSAQDRLDLLLSELIVDLPHWQASDILGATEGYEGV